MKVIRAILIMFFLCGCSGMSESMTVGFVKGMRAVPQYDFSAEEKARVEEAKERFEKLFNESIRKKLEEYELSDLKGWMVLLRFYSDGTTKTASLYLYTYWGEEERHEIYAVPLGYFLDKDRLPEVAERATQEVASYLLQKGASRFRQMADPGGG